MSFTFGNRPEDVITDSKGNTLSGVTNTFYATEADANARTSPLGSATSTAGAWSFTADVPTLWVRTPAGKVYPVTSAEATTADFTDQVNAAKNSAAASSAAAAAAQTAAENAAALVSAPADAAVAAIVGNPATATSTALSSTFAAQNTGRPASGLVVAIGDSITAWNGNGSPLRQRATWFQQLCARSRQRLRYGGVYATAGFTLAQIRDTHLPTVLALSPRPSACIVQGVTNDMAGTFDAAASFAVMQDICTQLMSKGIRPVLMLALPRNDAANADVSRWNTRIRRYADTIGALTLDAHTPLLSTTDGTRNAALYVAGDNIHPDWPGHTAIAQRGITDDLAAYFPAQRVTSKTAADATNLVAFGLFSADSNADGVADGWTSPATGTTKALIAPVGGDDLTGKWQQVTRATGGTLSTLLQPLSDITTGFSAGDRLAFSGRFQTSGVAGSGTTYSMQVAWQGITAQNLEAIYNWDVDIADGTWYLEGVVPAGTTGLRVQVLANAPTSGSPVIRVGEVTLRNLTTSGAS